MWSGSWKCVFLFNTFANESRVSMFAVLIDALQSRRSTSHQHGWQMFGPGSVLNSPLIHYKPRLENQAQLRAVYFHRVDNEPELNTSTRTKADITNSHQYLSFKLLLSVFQSLPRPSKSLPVLKDGLRLPLSHRFSRVMLEIREDFVVSWIQTGNCCSVFKLRAGRPLTDGDVNKEAVAESSAAAVGMQSLWTSAPAGGGKVLPSAE